MPDSASLPEEEEEEEEATVGLNKEDEDEDDASFSLSFSLFSSSKFNDLKLPYTMRRIEMTNVESLDESTIE